MWINYWRDEELLTEYLIDTSEVPNVRGRNCECGDEKLSCSGAGKTADNIDRESTLHGGVWRLEKMFTTTTTIRRGSLELNSALVTTRIQFFIIIIIKYATQRSRYRSELIRSLSVSTREYRVDSHFLTNRSNRNILIFLISLSEFMFVLGKFD